MRIKFLSIAIMLLLIASCGDNEQQTAKVHRKAEVKKVFVPQFNADSAYKYVAEQVAFGPRVPGTDAHKQCATYFVNFFENLNIKVYQQDFKARSFDGKTLEGKNIIAAINPDAEKRILLSAHWDSRPFADHDADESKHYTPIDGANDGASGVGVLMEIARQMSISKPNIGVDIILFDLEDYGQHASIERSANGEETWCLGSQHWAKDPHIAGYDAQFGILLDMIGAEGATFGHEYYSNQYAPGVIAKVWRIAKSIGYGDVFKDENGGGVLDDHVFINKYAYIPTIDIIHHSPSTTSGFFEHWHTMEDNMDKISKYSLNAVGETLMHVAYKE
ncbi:MAG: glutamine cyclotransferase [Bacteroidetes bacterium 4572_112]|nr:MAG: glutamine cyclotransferase [Bacteroidetes bacterium 4572_112]